MQAELPAERAPARDLDALRQSLEREFVAAQRGGVHERHLALVGRDVRLRIAGDALAGLLLPALAAAPGSRRARSAASIDVWEASTTPTPLPWDIGELEPGGLIRDPGGSGPVRAVHDTHQDAVTLAPARDQAAILHRVANHRRVPWWERAAPLKAAFDWALAGSGHALVHAAAVGDDRGAVLIVGPAGAGKTTAVLAALDAGLGLVADDYLALDTSGPIVAHALYGSVCIRHSGQPDLPKTVIDAGHALRTRLEAKVVALCTDSTAALAPVSPGAVLRAWGPTTVLQTPWRGARALSAVARTASSLPCFAIAPNHDPAGALDALLEAAA